MLNVPKCSETKTNEENAHVTPQHQPAINIAVCKHAPYTLTFTPSSPQLVLFLLLRLLSLNDPERQHTLPNIVLDQHPRLVKDHAIKLS